MKNLFFECRKGAVWLIPVLVCTCIFVVSAGCLFTDTTYEKEVTIADKYTEQPTALNWVPKLFITTSDGLHAEVVISNNQFLNRAEWEKLKIESTYIFAITESGLSSKSYKITKIVNESGVE